MTTETDRADHRWALGRGWLTLGAVVGWACGAFGAAFVATYGIGPAVGVGVVVVGFGAWSACIRRLQASNSTTEGQR